MNKDQAIEKILASIRDGAQVITPQGKVYEEYVKEQTEALLGNVIDPIRVNVVSASFPEYDFDRYKRSEVWAIAKSQTNWLLTLAEENEFALGFGDTAAEMMMLGFSSSDALAEWLG